MDAAFPDSVAARRRRLAFPPPPQSVPLPEPAPDARRGGRSAAACRDRPLLAGEGQHRRRGDGSHVDFFRLSAAHAAAHGLLRRARVRQGPCDAHPRTDRRARHGGRTDSRCRVGPQHAGRTPRHAPKRPAAGGVRRAAHRTIHRPAHRDARRPRPRDEGAGRLAQRSAARSGDLLRRSGQHPLHGT